MKSKIISSDGEKPEFPALYKSNLDGAIVMMWSEGVGVVLHEGFGIRGVGYYCQGWNMDYFKRLEGTVTIEFEC